MKGRKNGLSSCFAVTLSHISIILRYSENARHLIKFPYFFYSSIFVKIQNYQKILRATYFDTDTFFIYFFGYTRHATFYWKELKRPLPFREKLRPGESLKWAWFGDFRLIEKNFMGVVSEIFGNLHSSTAHKTANFLQTDSFLQKK